MTQDARDKHQGDLLRGKPFAALLKRSDGSFKPLMQGDESVGSVIDESTGRPVFVGQVQSSKIAGSAIWVPNENVSTHRLRVGGLAGDTLVGLTWYPATVADTETGKLIQVSGRQVTIGGDATNVFSMICDDPDGTGRYVLLQMYGSGTNANTYWTMDLYDGIITRRLKGMIATGGIELQGLVKARELIQTGTATLTTGGGGGTRDASATITFPDGFTSAPTVTATSANRLYNCAVESISATQATLAVSHIDGTLAISANITVRYIAVGPNA